MNQYQVLLCTSKGDTSGKVLFTSVNKSAAIESLSRVYKNHPHFHLVAIDEVLHSDDVIYTVSEKTEDRLNLLYLRVTRCGKKVPPIDAPHH